MNSAKPSRSVWDAVGERLGAETDGEAVDVWNAVLERIDLEQFRPKLAPDIEVKEFRLRWGNDYVMIANPRDLVHYRLAPDDAELLQSMDGTHTVKEIVLERFKEEGELELSGVIDLVRLLQEENFFEEPFVDVNAAVKRAIRPSTGPAQRMKAFAKTRTLEWKGADRLVRWLYGHGLRHVFSRQFAIASILLALVGFVAFVAIVRGGRFALAGESLAIGFAILLFLDYFSVFLHELGHALVLTKNGRTVKSAGFMIYFLSPAFFVEASDSLMMERRQSMLLAFAGPYTQFLIGGVCAMVAWAWPAWVFAPTLYKVSVINYFMVFLNLLPMLELDGYFILADAIQVPDLRPRSLSFVRHDLLPKLKRRERFNRAEVGLALYGILGVLFTGTFLVSGTFYWRTVFSDLVGRLWRGGTITRALLLILFAFIASPIVRGVIALARAVARLLRRIVRRLRFRLETRWRVEAASLIDALTLFDDVPVDVLDDLAGRVTLRALSSGQAVVRQGDRAAAFYVVRRGILEVVEEDPSTGDERSIRTLGRGEAFGEVGLKEGATRSATVRAVDEAEVFEIDESTFDRLLADMAHVPVFAPTIQAIADLKELAPFAHLEPDELSDLVRQGQWVNVAPGEAVVEEGEAGDSFFAIGSGQVEVYERGELLRTLGPGAFFGEVALLLDIPRTATVVAKTPVRLYRLGREGFDRVVARAFKKGTLNPWRAIDRTAQH